MKRMVKAMPTMRGCSGRTGQTSCMNMLRRPRRFSTPVRVEVPTRSSASRVFGCNSVMVFPPQADIYVVVRSSAGRRGASGAARMLLRSISGMAMLSWRSTPLASSL